jgi:CubicO group peptidase (beta-lactamase class C family)
MNRKSFSLMFLSLLFAVIVTNPGYLNAQTAAKTKKTVKPTEAKDIYDLDKLKRLDGLLKDAVANGDLPSAVCYISFVGEPIYYKAFGDAVREDKGKTLAKDAIFRIASQTKLVTTIALMRLYEEGLFNLEDPIKNYLPEFSNPVVYVSGSAENRNLVTRPAKGDITIRQLLCHSSGISYDKLGQDVEVIRYSYPISTSEAVSRIAKLPLKHDPGAGFTYGFSLDVAGRLAEVVTGMRLDSIIKKYVLDPLEMTNTTFYLNKNQTKRLVPVYTKPSLDSPVTLADSLDNSYPLNASSLYFGGGAGLSSTIEDYSNICNLIVNMGTFKGKRLLHKKTVEMITTDQLFGVAGNYQFGLGLEIATPQTFARTMKTVGSLRWGGYYGTEYLIDMKYKTVVQLYTNKLDWKSKKDVWAEVLKILYTSTLK